MSKKPAADRPIEVTQRVQKRVILMPRGHKNTAVRETKISLARVPSLEREGK